MWRAAFGSTLTAVLAAVATFQLSIPDRSPMWGLLPMPAALLWVGASGVGCLRTWIVPEMQDASLTQSEQCLLFILGLSIPLSVLLFTMLRRAYTLRPNLAAAIGGLSVAAASATLLTFFHPYDTTWTDLIVHVIAVAIVVITNWTFAGRLIDDKKARLHA